MNPKNDHEQLEQPGSAEAAPIPKKRFRFEKLEERIAPAAHYNNQSKLVGHDGRRSNDTGASGSSLAF